jgi:arylsulfatase A-like enzyme
MLTVERLLISLSGTIMIAWKSRFCNVVVLLPLSVLMLALFTPLSLANAEEEGRPNILFIYTDDHSYRTISCYPEAFEWAKTPNIDRIAREGMRFTHAYIGTWCMASRASLLTGHHQFGIESMRMVGKYPGSKYDADKCPFWPKIFRKSGYVTAQIGKWHTGTDTGFGRDWDYQIVWNRPAHPETSGNYYYNQPVTFHGKKTRMIKEYSTDKYTDWANEFIRGEGRDKNKPWYLWLCYGAVHSPYSPADRHSEDYQNINVPIPKDIYPPRPGKPDWMQEIQFWKRGKDGLPYQKNRSLTSRVRQYHQAVRAIDENVGRILKVLDETGQRKNTLIVFTADQGFAWGQHGFRHKMAAYDSNIRAPLIISMPGKIPEGSITKTPVGGIDLVPTFFKFAGIDLPWKMHGHDLSPILENPNINWARPVLLTNTGRTYGSETDKIPTGEKSLIAGIPWYAMLRLGNYKYIRALVKGELEELYDLKADPEELTNLAKQKVYKKVLENYRTRTISELKRTEAGFVNHLPEIR